MYAVHLSYAVLSRWASPTDLQLSPAADSLFRKPLRISPESPGAADDPGRTRCIARNGPGEVSRHCGFFAPIPRSCTTPSIDRPPLSPRLGFVTKEQSCSPKNRRRWRRRLSSLLIFAGRPHRFGVWFSYFLDDSPPPQNFPLARPTRPHRVTLITRALGGFDLYLHPPSHTRP